MQRMTTDARGPSPSEGRPRHRRKPRWNDEAITLLAAGAAVVAVSRETGVPLRTLNNWLRDEEFQQRVTQTRAAAYEQGVGRVGAYQAAAAEELGTLATSGSTETIRMQASKTLLELGPRLRSAAEVEARLAALERRTNAQLPPEGGAR